jgi:RNA polymerase sigma-54 factor
MVVGLSLDPRQTLEFQATPQLITFAELLELPSHELEQRIDHELELNPALERIESRACDWCGKQWRACADCIGPGWARVAYSPARDDALDRVVEPTTTYRTALDDGLVELSAVERQVAEYLFGNLDERGFLACSLDEAAFAMDVSVATIQHVLDVLRSTGSPALGARDVRECLLLQLGQLEREGVTHALARAIVAEHLEDLAARGSAGLTTILRVPVEQVQAAVAFIRTHLQPCAATTELEVWASPASAPRLLPDLAIRIADAPLDVVEVEVLSPVGLRVDPLYHAAVRTSPCRHVSDCVRRAESFLNLVERRADTIRRIVEHAASGQVSLLRTGRPVPRPPTRSETAIELGLHESTVSRAIANKLAVLPDGRLIPLSGLFEARLAAQEVLRQLVGSEERPFTDAELAARLGTLGYRLARRTVAKYRDALGIPAAAVRS